MRKLKLQLQMTVDGYMGGPGGEMDWVTMNWTDDINNYVTSILQPVDTIVLGRKLAEGFIPYWEGVANDVANPEHTGGIKFTETPKIVFSRTITESPWKNTTIAHDLVEDITALKAKDGGDIYACGGASFVASLIQNNLVDEYHLFINPVAISKGLPVFADLKNKFELELIRSTPFVCGITVMHYKPK